MIGGEARQRWNQDSMRMRTQLSALAILGALVASAWWFFGQDAGSPQGPRGGGGSAKGVAVIAEAMTLQDDLIVVRAIGTGKAIRAVDLFPSVSGEVMEVNFVDGSAVSENQVLLRLDDAEQRIAVSLAEVELQEAERQVKRFERLAPSGSVARASLDTARAGRDSARLRLEQAMEALTDRTVFAPFDGIIGLSEIHRGDRVSPETLIATLDDRTSLLVEFDISEQFVPRIRPGNDIELFAWTHPETVLRGEILAMGSQIDPSTRALRTRAIVPNPGGDIRPGTSFEVRLDLKGRSYPSVAEVAVLWSRDGPYVWRIRDDQTVEKVFSTIVRRDKGRVLLDGNLSVEDNIVVEGVQGLRDGTLVAPLSEERQKSEGEGRETS